MALHLHFHWRRPPHRAFLPTLCRHAPPGGRDPAMEFTTVLQIAVPSGLFGAVVIGGASSTLARWFRLRRRPFRLARRPRAAVPRRAHDFSQSPARTLAVGARLVPAVTPRVKLRGVARRQVP